MTTAYQPDHADDPASDDTPPRYEDLPAWQRRIYATVWAAEGRVLAVSES